MNDDGRAYMLRTCAADMSSHGGFVWPRSGQVTCPDWSPFAVCGNGLHGLLWGEGDTLHLERRADANWLVVEVDAAAVVDLCGKVKVPRGEVVFCGERTAAVCDIISRGADATKCCFVTLTAGDNATLTAGDNATLTAGDGAALTAGHRATLTAGHRATLTAGYGAILTAGHRATLTAGDDATLTAGHCAILTAGYGATLTAGDLASLTAEDDATLTAGYGATLTAGYGATLTAGDFSTLIFKVAQRAGYRWSKHEVGQGGVKADTPYRLIDWKLIEVVPEKSL